MWIPRCALLCPNELRYVPTLQLGHIAPLISKSHKPSCGFFLRLLFPEVWVVSIDPWLTSDMQKQDLGGHIFICHLLSYRFFRFKRRMARGPPKRMARGPPKRGGTRAIKQKGTQGSLKIGTQGSQKKEAEKAPWIVKPGFLSPYLCVIPLDAPLKAVTLLIIPFIP